MNVFKLAMQEIRAGFRNRWVVATTLLLAALALSLVLLGSAPTGVVKADPLAVVVVSLASLTIFLVPLIALLLSFDAIVGEQERGTLMLLLSYPVSRWEVILGKALGQICILGIATLLGYGVAAGALSLKTEIGAPAWGAFGAMVLTSIMLGAAFVSMGVLASAIVRERATAAGLAVGIWLFFVLLYDTALLGILVADQGKHVTQSTLDLVLLLNPADVYRIFNMTASDSVAIYSGLAGPGSAATLSPAVLFAVLAAWIVAPLALAVLAFRRKSV
ncbi:ABC transporter permease subunit [Lysobacter sp. A03]|uniref:ABC transporter permease subunit n=1 Tax=Lysobacter sp. A03 TaxID=1199154 RepID=UPI0005B6DC4B|nr:ABC transporter permease subunit [Lysobacter sp. A03]KIQ97021.1 Nitrous oxide reductase maturation transmembrane protein NosY [Lysobacter sp. A03]